MRYTIAAGKYRAEIDSIGAALHSFTVNRGGDVTDVVLGYPRAEGMLGSTAYIGAIVGPVANRIGGAVFSLDGVTYKLDKNDGPNCLHSGKKSFAFRDWDLVSQKDSSVTLKVASSDGDSGFPGPVSAEITYSLKSDGSLSMAYSVTAAKACPVSFTNHAYFNLNGHAAGSILKHKASIKADGYIPVGKDLIPIGKIEPVEGTAFDLREPKVIGEAMPDGGYDHAFVLSTASHDEPVATVTSEESGLTLEVYTDLPAIQFYTGNFVGGEKGKGGVTYTNQGAFCLETEYIPDFVNQVSFDGKILRPGEVYRTVTTYKVF